MLYTLLKPLAVLLFKIFFKIEVKGKDNIPQHQAFILASNHLSNLDPIVLGVASPRRLHFLAKEELFRNRLFSLFIKNLGAIPLKREGPDVGAMRQALSLLKKGSPLVIFPQGGRGQLQEAKLGIGFLFKKSSAPIVVARIFGTDIALPKGRFFLKTHQLKVVFDKATDISSTDTYQDISTKVLLRIKNLTI
jgi:1-acyl-sn-glycerol-3-phosphate acyltransferase